MDIIANTRAKQLTCERASRAPAAAPTPTAAGAGACDSEDLRRVPAGLSHAPGRRGSDALSVLLKDWMDSTSALKLVVCSVPSSPPPGCIDIGRAGPAGSSGSSVAQPLAWYEAGAVRNVGKTSLIRLQANKWSRQSE